MLQPGPHSAKQTKKLKKKLGPHRLGEGAPGCQGEGSGEGIIRGFGMDMCTCCIQNGSPTRTYCVVQGTLLNLMWQPGWKGSLGENAYMCMYD